jgi:hypothetical protein
MVLFAMVDHVYDELMGHQPQCGFATPVQVDAARAEQDKGLKSTQAGAPAIFAPGQPELVASRSKAWVTFGISHSGLAPASAIFQPATVPILELISE